MSKSSWTINKTAIFKQSDSLTEIVFNNSTTTNTGKITTVVFELHRINRKHFQTFFKQFKLIVVDTN